MRAWERLLYAVINEEERFDQSLEASLNELGLSVPEFCDRAGLSESSVYKIVSGHRQNIQLNNFRKIINGIKEIEQGEVSERSIAVITNRESLEEIRNTIKLNNQKISIVGYPSTTVEEALKQSIIAERDGVDAIVCGPITAHTIEDILHTPVVGLDVSSDQIQSAVETAVNKI